jgi:hypothetical protein
MSMVQVLWTWQVLFYLRPQHTAKASLSYDQGCCKVARAWLRLPLTISDGALL